MTAGIALAYGPAVHANTNMAGPFLTDISVRWHMPAFDEFRRSHWSAVDTRELAAVRARVGELDARVAAGTPS